MAAPENKEGRPLLTQRPAASKEMKPPMPSTTPYPTAETVPLDAIGALRAAVKHGTDHVLVACSECGSTADGGLAIVHEEYRQTGWPSRSLASLRLGDNGDAEDNASECNECGSFLDFDLVVLRDRHGRCARAFAEAA